MKIIKQVRIFERDRQTFDRHCRSSGQKLSSVIEYLAKEALKEDRLKSDRSRQHTPEDLEREKTLTSISIDKDVYDSICEKGFKFHSVARQLLNDYCERFRKTEELAETVVEEFLGEAIVK